MMETSRTPGATIERSMLYVPASRPAMIEKAAASEADAVWIDLVLLPKAHTPQDVVFVCMLLTQLESSRGLATNAIGIEAQIESAKGFLWAREIAQASPRLQGLI